MKISAQRKPLAEIVTAVSAVVNPRHVNSTVQNVMLDASDGKLVIRGTDLELWMQYETHDVSITTPGTVLVPGAMLGGILKDLQSDSVEFESEGNSLVLRGGPNALKLNTSDPEGFPEFPTFDPENVLSVDGAELSSCLTRSRKAIASDQGRYALHGVMMKPSADKIEFCGTDGRRLSLTTLNTKAREFDFTILLPARAIDVITRVSQRLPEEPVELDVRENEVLAKIGGAIVSSNLLNGQYPDYWSVIPRNNPSTFVANREEFLRAMRVVSHMASVESQRVALTIRSGELELRTSSFGTGSGEAKMPITYEGDEVKIGFDPRYLTDCLNLMSKEDIFCEFKDVNTGAIFHEEEKDQFFYLIMPLEVD